MTEFGGMGGITGGRSRDPTDRFEEAVERALGEQLRGSDEMAIELWSALANVDWRQENGDIASYSFRAAGDLIAAIRGQGDYMDWYCSGPSGVISESVRSAMAAEGWTGAVLG